MDVSLTEAFNLHELAKRNGYERISGNEKPVFNSWLSVKAIKRCFDIKRI